MEAIAKLFPRVVGLIEDALVDATRSLEPDFAAVVRERARLVLRLGVADTEQINAILTEGLKPAAAQQVLDLAVRDPHLAKLLEDLEYLLRQRRVTH